MGAGTGPTNRYVTQAALVVEPSADHLPGVPCFRRVASYAWGVVDPLSEHARPGRWLQIAAFVASAALAAATLRFAWEKPLISAALLSGVLSLALGRFIARRRLRRILRSGDVRSILERWSPSLDRIPHPATMGPLMMATAFAAYGRVHEARAALAAAQRGPAWDAALEHRLFLDALLLTFEGDRDAAIEQADRLERLPLPVDASRGLRDRVRMLRVAVGALARAFAHRTQPGDRSLLERASEASPLVFWAMRYAAAVAAIDEGDRAQAGALLASAPAWPEESTFRAFHDEILQQVVVPPHSG